ncbi:hypothetical protein PL75_03245 [Neisseria arctica]|uniref:HK97 gp10 family phage protein n=1 Tax=Neisseria arctica TaxID=1470200 RepID=A0A0J0YSX2_9NEIS|nr:hypothetical protein [Neisseria arctica]KLT73255.1 hypothetical protein PL75_03245 [Neisseria arctica]UOO87491.1 hypothetical protein LVJ86_04400 [Neisseria arctica]
MAWDKMPDMFSDLVREDVDKRVRGFAITCFRSIVFNSPVDQGRFKGSHIISVGNPDYTVTTALDKAGSITFQAGVAVINSVPVGGIKKIYIQTNLPYATRLENGWSKQAANGIYAVSFNYAVQAYK